LLLPPTIAPWSVVDNDLAEWSAAGEMGRKPSELGVRDRQDRSDMPTICIANEGLAD
jgi:hypothetical protein